MAEKGFGVKEVNLIGASGTPTITSPNNLNLNAVNVAISTNASIGGNLTVTGTVGIAGTLTYEDVTNIDAIGIVTARTGLKVLAGGANVVGVVTGSAFDGGIKVVAANSVAATVYPVFAGSGATQSGNLNLKTDNSLTYNSLSGELTAASFTGSGANLTSLPAANLTGTLPAISGANLTGIAVTEAPVTDYTITSNSSSAYRFHGGGVDETADNPDLYLIRGQKYRFNNTTGSGHPFAIRVSNGGSAYTDGVSGSNQGIQFFTVPYAAPASLVYQCTIHGGMVGNIYIRGGSSTANISNNQNNRIITGGSGGDLNAESGLTWDGTTLLASGSDAQLRLYDSTASSENSAFRLMAYNGVNYIQSGKAFSSDSKADLIFGSMFGGTTWVRIDSSGRVKIGNNFSATAEADDLIVGNLTGGHGISVFSQNNEGGFICFGDTNTTGVDSRRGVIRYQHSDDSFRFGVAGNNEKLRITSDGYVHLGNTAHGTNSVGGQAITGQDFDPIFKIYNSTASKWLMHLRNDNSTAPNGIFMRAGNASTNYTLYLTGGDENNPHLIVRGDGKVGINSTSPFQTLDVKGSINGGTVNQPFLRFHDSHGNQRSTKHYFKCVKGSTSIFDILTVDLNTNFHQALIILYYGARIQNGWDSTTFPVHKIIGVNRFNGGSIGFTKNTIVQDSTVSTHANIDAVATSSTQYRIRLTYSGTAGGSSFCCGSVEIIGVGSGTDGAFYSLAHGHGLVA
mgnify:CR=1 FL=1